MMVPIFNKITFEWNATESPDGLSSEWIINPSFSNELRAMEVGPKYWVYNGNIITGLTDSEIIENPVFKAEAQVISWKEISSERDRRKSNGVKVGLNWFHSDDTSRIQQIGLVMFGANMPAGIMWKTLTGSFVQMSPTLALQIFMAVAASDISIFTIAEQHKSAMLASQNPKEYDYSLGWPITFGE